MTPTALITGGSQGFGLALAESLVTDGWTVVTDARSETRLRLAGQRVPGLVGIPGDVTDPVHRQALAAAVESSGGLDLLVLSASDLGPSPLPRLTEYPLAALRAVFETNVVASVALIGLVVGSLRERRGTVVTVSSDAAVEAYEGWGGYGASKAALDHLARVLAAEEPELVVYAFDPGDMRTEMHQRAFPGEDISDRPLPETVVPALRALLRQRPGSGRYRAAELVVQA
jgi:NAD(P)-dependent dehydrogenase (short-subunit alcohol dehydrogenase family)